MSWLGHLIRAYLHGVFDGFDSPCDLGSGLTWSQEDNADLTVGQCDTLNETYDTGANHGQIVGGIIKFQWPQPWQHD